MKELRSFPGFSEVKQKKPVKDLYVACHYFINSRGRRIILNSLRAATDFLVDTFWALMVSFGMSLKITQTPNFVSVVVLNVHDPQTAFDKLGMCGITFDRDISIKRWHDTDAGYHVIFKFV